MHCNLEHNAYKCPEAPTLARAWSNLSYDTNLVLGMSDKILGTQFGHHMWDLWHLVNSMGERTAAEHTELATGSHFACCKNLSGSSGIRLVALILGVNSCELMSVGELVVLLHGCMVAWCLVWLRGLCNPVTSMGATHVGPDDDQVLLKMVAWCVSGGGIAKSPKTTWPFSPWLLG
jgi:hypothetical protein